MQIENQFPTDQIIKYCNYFQEIAYDSYLAPGVHINFKVVRYDLGVLVELLFFFDINLNHPNFIIAARPAIYICDSTSLSEAFKVLNITISDFLSGKQQNDLNEAIIQNRSYFTGTVKLYDLNNNKIIFIKEKKKELWTKDAAIQDIEKLINKARAMFSKLNH